MVPATGALQMDRLGDGHVVGLGLEGAGHWNTAPSRRLIARGQKEAAMRTQGMVLALLAAGWIGLVTAYGALIQVRDCPEPSVRSVGGSFAPCLEQTRHAAADIQ
jgi:hypothetical protein